MLMCLIIGCCLKPICGQLYIIKKMRYELFYFFKIIYILKNIWLQKFNIVDLF